MRALAEAFIIICGIGVLFLLAYPRLIAPVLRRRRIARLEEENRRLDDLRRERY